jgi:hypothetical protein
MPEPMQIFMKLEENPWTCPISVTWGYSLLLKGMVSNEISNREEIKIQDEHIFSFL